MTSASITTVGRVEPRRPLLGPSGWAWLVGLGLLFFWVFNLYLERLIRIVTQANGDNWLQLLISGFFTGEKGWNPDWSHALLIPVISAFYIYLKRDELAASQPRVCLWGLPVVLLGLLSYAFWIFPGRNDMFQGYSVILTLFGIALLLLGTQMMRLLWFPILYLVFAVKVADRLWDGIAWQMQNIASIGATYTLKFLGAFLNVDVTNRGSTIDLIVYQNGMPVQESLNVAEACSGLRMLMAFVALGVAMAFLVDRSWWQRLAIVAATIPVAIAINVGRVTTLGLLYLIDPALAKGSLHTMVGLVMLIPAAGLFFLLGWILDKAVIREGSGLPKPLPEPVPANQLAKGQFAHSLPAGNPGRKAALAAASLAGGVVIAAVLAATYLLMIQFGSPESAVLDAAAGSTGLLLAMGVKMAWIAVPSVLVAGLLGMALMAGLKKLAAVPHKTMPLLVPGCVVAGVLATTAVAQAVVVDYIGWALVKKPVPLQRSLVLVPQEIGPWKMVHEEVLGPEIIETLGTHDYISRIYHDTSLEANQPGSHVRLHVAYYTGTTDTVPHVPDRCFVAGGVSGMSTEVEPLTLDPTEYRADPRPDGLGGYLHDVQQAGFRRSNAQRTARVPEVEFPVTVFKFAAGDRAEVVTYFFAANGRFMPTPEHIRLSGFDPEDEYAYYCKVEVQLLGVDDAELAKERASVFLTDALPEIMACLPDWVEVVEGRYPREEGEQAPGR